MRRMRRGTGRTTASILKFSADLTSTDKILSPSRGIGTATFSGGGQNITDFEGKTRFVDSGWPAVPGSRVVRNLLRWSTDLSIWNKQNTATIDTFDAAGGIFRFNLGGTNGQGIYQTAAAGLTLTTPGRYARISIELMSESVAGGVNLADPGGGSPVSNKDVTVTTSWQRFSILVGPLSAGQYSGVWVRKIPGGLSSVLARNPQLEDVTGQTNQNPGEYVKTTSSPVTKCFDYLNPFSVDGNGVVTDSGVRTTISGIKGYLSEPSSTNKCTNYNTLNESYGATQSSGFTMVKGRRYEIVARATLDFTTVGAANNTVGTQFIATSATAIGTGDQVKEVINGLGTVATSSSPTAIQGVTLSGDAAATATIVDDSAALATAGLSQLVASGRVIKLDNSGGASYAYVLFSGAVGNTNPHTSTMHVRGSGSCEVGLIGLARTVFSGNASYVRIQNTVTPDTALRNMIGLVAAGAVAYFTINQLEELPYATTPIVVNGATATRAATSLSYSGANLRGNNVAVTMEWIPNGIGSSPDIFRCQQDVNNYWGVWHNKTTNTLTQERRVTGVLVSSTKSLTVSANVTTKIGARMSAISGIDTFADGAKGTGNSSATNATLGTSINIGSNAAGGNNVCGQIRNLRIYWQDPSDTTMIARTT